MIASLKSGLVAVGCAAVLLPVSLFAQTQDVKAQAIAREVIQTELNANRNDHTRWQYRSVYSKPGTNAIFYVIETDHGSVKKKLRESGRVLNQEELAAEDRKIADFISNPSEQEKQRKDGQADDKRAEDMMRMLPDAFLWSVKSDGVDEETLAFQPNPGFNPPSMEARVFAAMAGEIVVNKAQHRMKSMRGTLTNDVTFGWGLFGRMRKGGTFSVERREMLPGKWVITETHVHIDGKALMFKSISEQEDEVKTGFRQTPQAMTLEQAAGVLRAQPETVASR